MAPVTAQSVSMQQTFGSFVMHWGVPVPVSQTRLPVGQAHEPPGIEQTSPATALQSPSVQQAAFGMQLFEAGQTFWPAPQPQAPPGPEHV